MGWNFATDRGTSDGNAEWPRGLDGLAVVA